MLTGLDLPKSDQQRPLNPARARDIAPEKKPAWLKIRPPAGEIYLNLKSLIKSKGLHTVCEEAHCPNVAECWASGTATFMLGGDTCTRACRFCAIKTARIPPPLNADEPRQVAESVSQLKLKYVVLTSVDRDDLQDGGAGHFAETIRGLKIRQPNLLVEALVPDFQGELPPIQIVVDSGLDVYAHNVETVARLQYRVRDPRASYMQSLMTLRLAKRYAQSLGKSLVTKSSIMLGLGETESELRQAFADLREHEVDVLTLGQYLRPSLNHLPVDKFYTEAEFDALGVLAKEAGFLYVASGPMVRSSYKAAEFFIEGMLKKNNVTVKE